MKILRDHSLGLSNAEIEHLCEIADKNHDGNISLEEFIGESERRKREAKAKGKRGGSNVEVVDRVEQAFTIFDTDKDGYVTKQEFLRSAKNLTPEQVSAVYSRIDEDGDGKLNKEEFIKMMTKSKK